jgi:hypothetical protein
VGDGGGKSGAAAGEEGAPRIAGTIEASQARRVVRRMAVPVKSRAQRIADAVFRARKVVGNPMRSLSMRVAM